MPKRANMRVVGPLLWEADAFVRLDPGAQHSDRLYPSMRTLCWNGETWTHVPSPSPGPSGSLDFLNGLTLTSQGNAWGVGEMALAPICARLPAVRQKARCRARCRASGPPCG